MWGSRESVQKKVWSSFVVLAFCCSANAQPGQTIQVHSHKKVDITDSVVDDILTRANAVLQKQGNAACAKLVLTRKSPTTTYGSDLPDSVISELDFQRFEKAGDGIYVVKRITWCGDDVLSTGGALGCASMSGRAIVVIRHFDGLDDDFNSGVEPITWLHELGHLLGLAHNDVDASDIMAPGLDPGSIKINSEECQAFGGEIRLSGDGSVPTAAKPKKRILPSQSGSERVMLAQVPIAESVKSDSPSTPMKVPLEQFIKQQSTAGISQSRALQYSSEVRLAEQMLVTPQYAPYRSKIIALLGLIGTPETVALLQKIVETPVVSAPTEMDIQSRLAALIAIGTIANRYQLPEHDFDVLRQAVKPTYWEVRLAPAVAGATVSQTDGVPTLPANDPNQTSKGHALDQDDIRSLSRALSIQAYRGYALTGSLAVQSKLYKDRTMNGQAAIPKALKEERDSVINEALRLNAVSRAAGAVTTIR